MQYILTYFLKGTNQSFDTLITDSPKKDYSFTLLEATYLERTGLYFEPSDYGSFGLVDKNGFLTNAGKLMTDQHTVYNSRMFCTRWNGLEKGSIFDDALDDKEYEGNLIYLLKSGSEFIRNNSKVSFWAIPHITSIPIRLHHTPTQVYISFILLFSYALFYDMLIMLSNRYPATGGGERYKHFNYLYHHCCGRCDLPSHLQMVRQT